MNLGIARLSTIKKREAWLLLILCFMVAITTSLQDYFGAKWNGIYYDFYESMAYKLFWLLFIPFYLLFDKVTRHIHGQFPFNKKRLWGLSVWMGLPAVIGIAHLLLFAYLLYAISPLFNNEHWDLGLLIKEKLTTRLYLVLVVYTILSYVRHQNQQKEGAPKGPKMYNGHITVKHGGTSTLISTHDIKWIKADSGYLQLQTNDRKHVIVDSLKNLHSTLDPNQFKRIHKSIIVNTQMIKGLRSRNNGDYDVILKDGSILRLSRNYAKELKEGLL